MGKPFSLVRHHPLSPLRPLFPRISRGGARNVHAKRLAYVRDRGLSASLIRQSPGHGRDLSGVANNPCPRSVHASNVSVHSPRRVRSTGRRCPVPVCSVRAVAEPCPDDFQALSQQMSGQNPSRGREASCATASKYPVKHPATGRAAVAALVVSVNSSRT